MRQTLSEDRLKEWIESGNVTILDENGDPITEKEMWDQYNEGWYVGVLTNPVSNTIVKTWVVSTASHKKHHGFDAGAIVDAVVNYEEIDYEGFVDDWNNSGGMVWEIE